MHTSFYQHRISRPKKSIKAEAVISFIMYTYWLKQVLFHHLIKLIIDFVILFFCSWSQHKLLQKTKPKEVQFINLKSLISSGICLRWLRNFLLFSVNLQKCNVNVQQRIIMICLTELNALQKYCNQCFLYI